MASQPLLHEDFRGENFDSRLQWQNEPSEVRITEQGLEVSPDKGSDNWCRTHYDWGVHDSAHFLFLSIPDDDKIVEITTRVRLFQKALYDQAGLLIRRGPGSWIKCSTEFGAPPEISTRLGSVVTNNGYSDWATQPYDATEEYELSFRMIKYHTSDVCIEYREQDSEPWKQIRITHLFPIEHKVAENSIKIGLYCCAPTEKGFRAEFQYLKVVYLKNEPTD